MMQIRFQPVTRFGTDKPPHMDYHLSLHPLVKVTSEVRSRFPHITEDQLREAFQMSASNGTYRPELVMGKAEEILARK